MYYNESLARVQFTWGGRVVGDRSDALKRIDLLRVSFGQIVQGEGRAFGRVR